LNNKLLIFCQGIQKSKIIASILSHSPRECVIIRSLYDINIEVRSEIQEAINLVIAYITGNIAYFTDLGKIWEINADIFNPNSVLKSLEGIVQKGSFSEMEPIIDLSTGAIPANIGLYLFALKYKIKNISFCFPGERYERTEGLAVTEKYQKEIEFARTNQYNIPLISAKIQNFDEEILFALGKAEGGKINTLQRLNEKLNRIVSSKTLMGLSRQCDKLNTLGLISSRRVGKNKKIILTSSGRQYIKFKEFNKPSLKLIWQRNKI